MKTLSPWSPIRWPGNDAPEFAPEVYPCHKRQIGKGRFCVILHPGLWPSEGWSYVASFGADSERSHSGFLPGLVSIDSAKAEIERQISTGKYSA